MAKVTKTSKSTNSSKAAVIPKGNGEVAKRGRGRPRVDAPAEVKMAKRPAGVVKKTTKNPKKIVKAKAQKRASGDSKVVKKEPKKVVKAKTKKQGTSKKVAVEKKKTSKKSKNGCRRIAGGIVSQEASRTAPKGGKGGRSSKKAVKKSASVSARTSPKGTKNVRKSKKSAPKQAPARTPTTRSRSERDARLQEIMARAENAAEDAAQEIINPPLPPPELAEVQPIPPPMALADNAEDDVAQALNNPNPAPNAVALADNSAADVALAVNPPPPAPDAAQPIPRPMTNAAAYAELLQTLSDYQRQQVEQLRSYIASQREANDAHLARLRAIVEATEQQ